MIELGAGVRPGLSRQFPARLRARGSVLHVNGLYRHGFLLAPAMARAGGRDDVGRAQHETTNDRSDAVRLIVNGEEHHLDACNPHRPHDPARL